MGVEYRLYKTGKPESYELGKPAKRMPTQEQIKGLDLKNPVGNFNRNHAILDPSDAAMWDMGGDDGNCGRFRMDKRWTEAALAERLQVACLQEDDWDTAIGLARSILAWAMEDEVMMIPDALEIEDICDRLGVRPLKWRDTGSVYEPMKEARTR